MQQFQPSQAEQHKTLSYSLPEPHQTPVVQELEVAARIKEDWEKRNYVACLNHFATLPSLTLSESVKCLSVILYPPAKRRLQSFQTRMLKYAITQEALNHLSASPHREATASLTIALFHPNKNIAHRAEAALAQRGQEITSALITVLMHPTPPPYWNPKGTLRVLHLLRQYGDKRASHTLIRAAQKELPVLPDMLLRYPLYISFLACNLLMIPLGAVGAVQLYISESLNYLLPALIGWLAVYVGLIILLYIPLFFFISPFYIAQERWIQKQFSLVALQALQAIPDKRMVPYLIRLTWNGAGFHNEEALKALRPLLPLVTSKDISLFPSCLEESALIHGIDRYDAELTLSILHVLECIGTATSLPKVYRTIKNHPNDTIGAQAKQAAEAIRIREAQKEEERTLLRASETPLHTHELLRPTEEDHNQEILRRELLRPEEEN